jgi:endoglucanase
MKKALILLLVLFLQMPLPQLQAQNLFNKGVNLTNWFQSGSTQSIPFAKYTQQDLVNIKSLGCDVIRLPINLHFMTGGAPDYVIDPLLFTYLDTVVNWAEKLQINLILDNHTIDGANNISIEAPVIRVWPQMAKHFKNRSSYLFYEILNEPNTMTTASWTKIQQKAIDSIRKYDTKHTIVVGGSGWNSISEMSNLPVYTDANLVYTFHFYDPFIFTHQGASWSSPSMIDLKGVPFPYDAARLPACPASLKGTWIEGNLSSSYKTDGTIARLQTTLDEAINFGKIHGVKIYCGELGVYNLNSNNTDRVAWYQSVCSYLNSKSLPFTMWDYQGGFGLFTPGSNEMYDYDINVPLAEALGFTPPPQKVYTLRADSVPFDVYLDYPCVNMIQGGGATSGIIDFFSTDAYSGSYAVHVSGIPQYSAVDFDFRYNKDLSRLVAENYALDFWVKGDASGSDIVVRFLDTKTSAANDHPWRMDYTVNASKAAWDNNWHHVNIPLTNFTDAGSWDGSWFNSANSFDWKATDHFQIVSEHMDLKSKNFWFDNLRITNDKSLSVNNTEAFRETGMEIFPNPAAENAHISATAAEAGELTLEIYSLKGQHIVSLYHGLVNAGNQSFIWNLADSKNKKVSNGLYICKMRSGMVEIIKKIAVAR